MAPTEGTTDPERKTTQLRIEADLWDRAQEHAKRRRMSTNAYICLAVEQLVARDDEASAQS